MRRRLSVMIGLASVILATVWASSGGSAGAAARHQTVVPVPNQFNTVPFKASSGPAGAPGVTRVGRNVNITNASGAQSETSIAIDPTDSHHFVAASNDLANFSSYKGVYESF